MQRSHLIFRYFVLFLHDTSHAGRASLISPPYIMYRIFSLTCLSVLGATHLTATVVSVFHTTSNRRRKEHKFLCVTISEEYFKPEAWGTSRGAVINFKSISRVVTASFTAARWTWSIMSWKGQLPPGARSRRLYCSKRVAFISHNFSSSSRSYLNPHRNWDSSRSHPCDRCWRAVLQW